MFRSVHRGRRLPSQVIQLHRRAASSTAVARLPGTLVSSEWLKQNLVGVKVVDGSWHMPAEKRNPHKDFLSQRIPTARFFDVDAISDRSTDLPHMLPSNEEFADAVGRGLGISDTDSIVVYDTKGVFSAPRVAWTFKLFGAKNVAVLDGGLPAWLHAKLETANGEPKPVKPAIFRAKLDTERVKTLAQVRDNITSQRSQVVDARSRGRFAGTDPEPRPGVRGGHIPQSLNVPFGEVLTQGQTIVRFKQPAEIKKVFTDAGIDYSDPDRPLITSCGTGVTAAVLAWALQQTGYRNVELYDGSWCDWGANKEVPIATGPK